MTSCGWHVAPVLLAAPFVFATPGEAQRSGWIFGGGLGAGVVSYSSRVAQYGISEGGSDAGVAADFHFGRVISNSFEVYLVATEIRAAAKAPDAYPNELAYLTEESTSFWGVGLTYSLNASVAVKGAVGLASESISEDIFTYGLGVWDGLGLLVGGRYGFADRWALDLNVMRSSWNSGGIPDEEGTAWAAGLTLNWLSR